MNTTNFHQLMPSKLGVILISPGTTPVPEGFRMDIGNWSSLIHIHMKMQMIYINYKVIISIPQNLDWIFLHIVCYGNGLQFTILCSIGKIQRISVCVCLNKSAECPCSFYMRAILSKKIYAWKVTQWGGPHTYLNMTMNNFF